MKKKALIGQWQDSGFKGATALVNSMLFPLNAIIKKEKSKLSYQTIILQCVNSQHTGKGNPKPFIYRTEAGIWSMSLIGGIRCNQFLCPYQSEGRCLHCTTCSYISTMTGPALKALQWIKGVFGFLHPGQVFQP